MKYKYHKIIFDLITKRVTLSRIRSAMAVDDLVTRIVKLKRVKITQLINLTYAQIEDAVEIYNRYTTGKEIKILDRLPIIIGLCRKLIDIYNSVGGYRYLSAMISGLACNKHIAAKLIKSLEAFMLAAKHAEKTTK